MKISAKNVEENPIPFLLLLGVVLVGLLWLSTLFVIVPAGERGVMLDFGAVVNQSLEPGLYIRLPVYQSIEIIDARTQKVEANASAASKDLQNVHTAVVLNYHTSPSAAPTIYQNTHGDYLERIIKPAIQESVKASTAQYNAEELITQRPVVKEKIRGVLHERLLRYDIIVEDISVTNFEFSESYTKAIEAKQVAEQEALQASRILDRKRIEAEQIVVTAGANKNAIILEAEGRAEALRIQRQQITPELNTYSAIQKWDGKMPQFVGGPLPFVDLGKLVTESKVATP